MALLHQASKIRCSDGLEQPIFSVGQAKTFKRLVCRTTVIFCPSDSIYLKPNVLLHKGLTVIESQPIVVVLTSMICMMFIPRMLSKHIPRPLLHQSWSTGWNHLCPNHKQCQYAIYVNEFLHFINIIIICCRSWTTRFCSSFIDSLPALNNSVHLLTVLI